MREAQLLDRQPGGVDQCRAAADAPLVVPAQAIDGGILGCGKHRADPEEEQTEKKQGGERRNAREVPQLTPLMRPSPNAASNRGNRAYT